MAKNPQFTQDALTTNPYPKWIVPLDVHEINARMMRLIKFYVLNSPCKESSWGRKSMADYGWVNYWNSTAFRQRIFDVAELDKFNQCDSATSLKREWPEMENYYGSQQEYAYFVAAGEESPLMNLFHRVRNAFAHGRFRLNGEYFFFEDVDSAGTTVKARICLKRTSLENWMKVISCDDVDAKAIQEKMKHKGKTKEDVSGEE